MYNILSCRGCIKLINLVVIDLYDNNGIDIDFGYEGVFDIASFIYLRVMMRLSKNGVRSKLFPLTP